ncbi:hypothetical protein WAI453_003969 [Rhynchosporium graminicola]|uniref:Uncharacterized protein n=1 Tax=Rhynchosporium graminicola TaxID=2792576 RepID=A0A1E1JY29_9HELO|nr:uncharacterized protein RCO7_06726 [Rhynchosporium commune]
MSHPSAATKSSTLKRHTRSEQITTRMSTIYGQIHQIVDQVSSIQTQLHAINSVCYAIEKAFNELCLVSFDEASQWTDFDEKNLDASLREGDVYFVVDDEEKYKEIVRRIVEMEMEDRLKAEGVKEGRNGEEVSE